MRYPKPGYPNPLVSVHVLDLERFLSESSIGNSYDPAESTLELEWSGRFRATTASSLKSPGSATAAAPSCSRRSIATRTQPRRLFDVSDTSLLAAGTGRVVRTLGKDARRRTRAG